MLHWLQSTQAVLKYVLNYNVTLVTEYSSSPEVCTELQKALEDFEFGEELYFLNASSAQESAADAWGPGSWMPYATDTAIFFQLQLSDLSGLFFLYIFASREKDGRILISLL